MNSLLLCIPFAGLLLCIAVMPLVKPEWWEKNQALAVILWSFLFIIPSVLLNGAGETAETVLECIINDYLTFIVLLFGLFCVSGNITLEGNLAGSPGVDIKIEGLHNIIFLVVIVVAVILSGTLPGLPVFQDAAGNVIGIKIFKEVKLTVPAIIEIVMILAAAGLSFKTTPQKIRTQNHFTWGAIKEVAVLFVGIFITMQPALALLKTMGPNLGITEPYQMFWSTGMLSSFLDNTPTYLVFLTTAGTLGFTSGITTTVGTISVQILEAISCGAVFMGANTYIGNAPNFMVKSISDENGVRMPSFFGYMVWSFGILVPVFIIDTLVFFL